MVLAMHPAHLLEQRPETHNLRAHKLVMCGGDVRDQFRQRFPLPIAAAACLRLLLRAIQFPLYLLKREIRRLARFSQWLVAAAAVINSQFFEHSCRCGALQSQFPHGFFSNRAHTVLLEASLASSSLRLEEC